MCIGFHFKETAKGSAISSLETRDVQANAHAPNYSPIKARSSSAFKIGSGKAIYSKYLLPIKKPLLYLR
jgi:hypothetical protein